MNERIDEAMLVGVLDAAPDMRGRVSEGLVVAGKSEAEVSEAAAIPQVTASAP